MLDDDALLAIFEFCVDEEIYKGRYAWHTLVHVCRRWRGVVFGSPRRLNLRLVCEAETPARDMLDIWPALPLVIQCFGGLQIEKVDDIVAVLERSNRVCQINLMNIPSSCLEKISMAMQEPFPELTYVSLWSDDNMVLPDSFLGGSTPRLRHLYFRGIPFPGLPKLLLSATHLVDLQLSDIPHSGYFPPDAMVTALSTLTNLRELHLKFQSPLSRPTRTGQRPPPSTCTVLPVLTDFWFKGVTEYLDDLVTHIDAPQLSSLYITFFNQIVFDTPQLVQFISRTPTLKLLGSASLTFDAGAARVELAARTTDYGHLEVKIPCLDLDWQISSMEQVCTSCLPPLSMLKDVYINDSQTFPSYRRVPRGNIENALWLELLHPFTAVKKMYLSDVFARRLAPALQELVGRRTTEVLPTLENIYLEGFWPSGYLSEDIKQFVASRQVTGHPIAVSHWAR